MLTEAMYPRGSPLDYYDIMCCNSLAAGKVGVPKLGASDPFSRGEEKPQTGM